MRLIKKTSFLIFISFFIYKQVQTEEAINNNIVYAFPIGRILSPETLLIRARIDVGDKIVYHLINKFVRPPLGIKEENQQYFNPDSEIVYNPKTGQLIEDPEMRIQSINDLPDPTKNAFPIPINQLNYKINPITLENGQIEIIKPNPNEGWYIKNDGTIALYYRLIPHLTPKCVAPANTRLIEVPKNIQNSLFSPQSTIVYNHKTGQLINDPQKKIQSTNDLPDTIIPVPPISNNDTSPNNSAPGSSANAVSDPASTFIESEDEIPPLPPSSSIDLIDNVQKPSAPPSSSFSFFNRNFFISTGVGIGSFFIAHITFDRFLKKPVTRFISKFLIEKTSLKPKTTAHRRWVKGLSFAAQILFNAPFSMMGYAGTSFILNKK